jgi:N-formylglutamate amidohydrolase
MANTKKPAAKAGTAPTAAPDVEAFRNTLNEVLNNAVESTMDALHPAYFAIAFRTEAPVAAWPPAFVIITAYATTGETWSDERNTEADQRLHAELLRRGCTPIRITGYDPATGHAEPGWAAELPLDEALDLGRDFLQDAIFVVQGDALAVVPCNSRPTQHATGHFRERVSTHTQQLVLHIPHASTTIPLRDGYVVDDAALLAEQLLLTDWLTDDLFANPTDTAIVAHFSRVFCDVERFADDAQEVMASVGMGVLYTHSDAGMPLRAVSNELRERVLQEHYGPHHQRLTAAVDAQLLLHGQATLVDCHSFPALPFRRDLEQQLPRPDFNIGTDAFHTPVELIQRATAYFAQAGYTLGVDRPYRGTLVPMAHYQLDARVRSIMLEVNRDLYLQPGTNSRNARFDAIKGVVQGFLDAMRQQG